jgi:hypothetical protein
MSTRQQVRGKENAVMRNGKHPRIAIKIREVIKAANVVNLFHPGYAARSRRVLAAPGKNDGPLLLVGARGDP